MSNKNKKVGKLQMDEEIGVEDTQIEQSNEVINMINDDKRKTSLKAALMLNAKSILMVLAMIALLLALLFIIFASLKVILFQGSK